MGMLKFEVPSTVPVDDARQRVEALLSYWNRKYGITSSWNGLKATMKGKAVGVTIDGNLEVLPNKIAGEASDPGMLLRGQAQKYLTRKFSEYLDGRRSLDDIRRGED
ncbi:MAG: polyhydroxyalkanoic acid system family protein [Myxococcus sp.]|nr:polyhydroxyalkanoic acid system family protein [Myxococcus sp.]